MFKNLDLARVSYTAGLLSFNIGFAWNGSLETLLMIDGGILMFTAFIIFIRD